MLQWLMSLFGSNKKPTKKRSSHWPALRQEHLKAHPTCAACGSRAHLEVHHLHPFHLFPAEELDPRNLLTLCESPEHNCHLQIGHRGNWSDYNPRAVADAAAALRKEIAHAASVLP